MSAEPALMSVFNFVVVGNRDHLPGLAHENNVLRVFPAFKAELPLENLAVPLPAPEGQVGKRHVLSVDLEPRSYEQLGDFPFRRLNV